MDINHMSAHRPSYDQLKSALKASHEENARLRDEIKHHAFGSYRYAFNFSSRDTRGSSADRPATGKREGVPGKQSIKH